MATELVWPAGRVPTKDDLISIMEVCIEHRDTSWFYEFNLIDLHDAIHRYYDLNGIERQYFAASSKVHNEDDTNG